MTGPGAHGTLPVMPPTEAGAAPDPRREILARLDARRADDGAALRGTVPQPPGTLECRLEYPLAAPPPPGALFRAAGPDEKWDVFHFDDSLYFVRSASGALEYRAALAHPPGRLRIARVTARAELAEAEPAYVVATVDFLVRTHVFGLESPHPLPATVQGGPEELALLSWRLHGRFARFASRADTCALPPGTAALERD